MIQRIQTLYMLVSIAAMVVLYFLFPTFSTVDTPNLLQANSPVMLGLLIGSVILTLLSIISYKTRQRQFVLNRLAILLNFVLLGVFVYQSLTAPGENYLSEKGVGMFMPIISIVFLVLANKAIKRDEDLVKSVDRLR